MKKNLPQVFLKHIMQQFSINTNHEPTCTAIRLALALQWFTQGKQSSAR
jgi:hypothetical protein